MDLERELNGFVKRFSREDYGFVTRAEAENNSENKWLCGTCCWSIGRYSFENNDYANQYGGIVLEFLQDRGFIYSIEENMDEIYSEYAHKQQQQIKSRCEDLLILTIGVLFILRLYPSPAHLSTGPH